MGAGGGAEINSKVSETISEYKKTSATTKSLNNILRKGAEDIASMKQDLKIKQQGNTLKNEKCRVDKKVEDTV